MGVYGLAKIVISLKYKPEEYDALVKTYNDEGRLEREDEYKGIKQVVIHAREVRISRQIAPSPIVLVVEAVKPRYRLVENNILYVEEEG